MQKDYEFEASPGYIARLFHLKREKKNQKTKTTNQGWSRAGHGTIWWWSAHRNKRGLRFKPHHHKKQNKKQALVGTGKVELQGQSHFYLLFICH